MTAVTDADLHASHDDGHAHPDSRTYWSVAAFLAVMTAIETSTYWWPKGAHKAAVVVILILMVIKFVAVAAYFMHLKFDAKILRRAFTFGLILAIIVYLVTLSAFEIFKDSGTTQFVDPPRSKPLPPPPPEPPPVIRGGGGGGH